MDLIQPLVELDQRAVGIPEDRGKDAFFVRLAVGLAGGFVGFDDKLHARRLELLDALLEIIHPEGKMMDANLVQPQRLA